MNFSSKSAKGMFTLMKQDLKFLYRQGLLFLYLFLTLLYSLLLIFLPRHLSDLLFPVILFSDPAVMSFFFSAAMIFIESQQGTLSALFVSPLTIRQYLLARCLSLGTIVLVVTLVLSLVHGVFSLRILPILLGMGLSSVLFNLLGVFLCMNFDSFTAFLILGGFLELPLLLPLLGYFRLADHWVLRLFPTDGLIFLLSLSQNQPFSPGRFILSLVVLLIPILFLIILTEKKLRLYLVRRSL